MEGCGLTAKTLRRLCPGRAGAQLDCVQQWRQDGFSIFQNAIDPRLIDELADYIQRLPESNPPGLLVTGSRFSQPYRPEIVKPHESIRIVGIYFFSDTAYVIMNSSNRMDAIWIALEDIPPGSGELVYYPGSHHWNDYLFSGRFKHFGMEREVPSSKPVG